MAKVFTKLPFTLAMKKSTGNIPFGSMVTMPTPPADYWLLILTLVLNWMAGKNSALYQSLSITVLNLRVLLGIVTKVTDHQEMLHGLNVMTDHYIKEHPEFTERMLGKVTVWRLDANKISARIHIPAGLKDMQPGEKLSGPETVYGDPNITVDLDALASASQNADYSDVYTDNHSNDESSK